MGRRYAGESRGIEGGHMHQRQTVTTPRQWTPWPPDDSEESVVGSEYHQHVIDAVRDGLRMAARANGAEWHTQSQLGLTGFRRPDGSAYSMLPDVFVHPHPNPHPESGELLTTAEVGVPLLAIEVLSASTFRHDLDEQRGKAWSYADAGVAEYLVVDYGLQYTTEHVWARRLQAGGWGAWPIGSDGRWESPTLGVSFAFDGLYLRVYDAQGRLKPLPQEADVLLIERDEQLRAHERHQAALLTRLGALADAGDLEALRALLAQEDRPR
jgi:hypothetical protein